MYSKLSTAYRQAQRQVSSFFEVHGEGDNQYSDCSQVIAGLGDVFAQKIGVTVQMAIKGSIGGSTKALNKELEQVAIAENPNLAMAEYLPKSLKKNPLALMGLNSIMARLAAGGLGSAGPGPSNGKADQAQFNL